jgi:polyisoprenoid-binding protein YceI
MKKTIMVLSLLSVVTFAVAQKKKVTTSATISFDATTPKDALPKADNKTVIASLDTKSGATAFEALVKSFTFSNPTMQEHFNAANWMDSEKFPKATFKGKITNLAAVNFKKDGTYTANITGDLTMHGVTKPVTTIATITVKGKEVSTSSNFTAALADFDVKGPAIAAGKLAEVAKITVSASFK